MKKFTHFLGVVLAALVLMPMSVMAEQLYPTLTFVDATGATTRTAEATLGVDFTAPTLTCNYPEVLRYVRYSSTNERVAFVDSISGYVTPYSAGTTTITAYFAGDSTYGAARAMYSLTVKEAETPVVEPTCPAAYFYADGEPIKVLTLKVGETASIPTLLGETGAIYRLSRKSIENSQVATLTEDDMILAVAEGQTSLIGYVSIAAEDQTLTCDYYLVITVEAADTPVTTECPQAHFNLPSADNVLYMEVGQTASIPDLLGETGAIYELAAKTVEGIRVAELTEDEVGKEVIKAVGEGTAQFIGMIKYGTTADGEAQNCEYSFDIVVTGAAQELADPEFSFDPKEVNLELGDKFIAPTLVNPHDIVLTPNNCKWYTNWDSKVAQVDEATGEVTLLGEIGDETISFEFTGNDTYKPAIASYVIHVTTSGLVVGGIIVNNSNKDNILNDEAGSITYDPITHTLTMKNAIISGAGIELEGAPARVKEAKADELPESGILYTDKQTLTIVLVGRNAISNVDAGIFSQSAPVVIMNNKDAFGAITITANTVGIKAEALKIFKCNVSAFGGSAAVAVNELGVATGANLVAEGKGLAIQANSFIAAEDNDGVGIDILTEGVYFEKNVGFMLEVEGEKPVLAPLVEIGQKVVVPTTEEVTTIDFSNEDPDENETVVFSASENGDGYNPETQQLEIVTTLTDEEVAAAMESVMPGSSAWIDLLPGSLTFDIPAGEGEIRVFCMTVSGYTLKVKLEGVDAAVTITQEELGWAKVTYNTTVAIHVVIYLHADSASPAPARIAASTMEDPTPGAFIKAVKIAPKDAPDPNPSTDINEPTANDNVKAVKSLKNGQLFIIRDGKTFTATGIEIK